MRQEKSFGVVPIRETPAGRLYLLVQHRAGHWGFPKGKQEKGERPLETARRELREETGVADADIAPGTTFSESYQFIKPRSGEAVRKTVTYFLGRVAREDVTILPDELSDFAWLDAAAASARLTYPAARGVLEAVETHFEKTT